MVARAVDNEAPYFVDYIGEVLDATFPGIVSKPGTLDVYTTLDLNLQRDAQDAVREGLAVVDKALARRKRGPARVAQAALVAIDPRSGEILAFIGGRSYNQSQFNRAVSARRQIGSTFKPFVYLAAFEKAADDGTATSPRRRSSTTSPPRGATTTRSGRRATTTVNTTAPSRCGARWPCRATSPRSRSPSKPATTGSWRCGRRPRSANPIR